MSDGPSLGSARIRVRKRRRGRGDHRHLGLGRLTLRLLLRILLRSVLSVCGRERERPAAASSIGTSLINTNETATSSSVDISSRVPGYDRSSPRSPTGHSTGMAACRCSVELASYAI